MQTATMPASTKYTTLASQPTIEKTVRALWNNGMTVIVVDNGMQAREKVRELLPKKAQVMNMTSITLDTIGTSEDITVSDNYDSVRDRLMSMDKHTQGKEMRQLSVSPDWVVGSVHAITEDGQIMIASATGSQLPAYVYGAAHVVWVAGTQKIVRNLDEGFNRINEHSYVLENKRSKRVYGAPSNISKILIVNKEVAAGRITVLLVKELLGF